LPFAFSLYFCLLPFAFSLYFCLLPFAFSLYFCLLPFAFSLYFSPNQVGLGDRKHLLPFGICPVGVAKEDGTVGGAGGKKTCQEMDGTPFCQQDAGWKLPAAELGQAIGNQSVQVMAILTDQPMF
jgi:hypothetical protein